VLATRILSCTGVAMVVPCSLVGRRRGFLLAARRDSVFDVAGRESRTVQKAPDSKGGMEAFSNTLDVLF